LHQVTINGKQFSSNKKIKSATYKEAGHTKKVELQQLHKKDSGQISEQNKVVVHNEEKIKEKEVQRTGANYLITISLAILLIAAAGISWKLGWFKRKKDSVNHLNI